MLSRLICILSLVLCMVPYAYSNDCVYYLDPKPTQEVVVDPRITDLLLTNPNKKIATSILLRKEYRSYYPILFKLLDLNIFSKIPKGDLIHDTPVLVTGRVSQIAGLFAFVTKVGSATSFQVYDLSRSAISPVKLDATLPHQKLRRSGLTFRELVIAIKRFRRFTHMRRYLSPLNQIRDGELMVLRLEFDFPINKVLKRLVQFLKDRDFYVLDPRRLLINQPNQLEIVFLEGAKNPGKSLQEIVELPGFFRGYATPVSAQRLARDHESDAPLKILNRTITGAIARNKTYYPVITKAILEGADDSTIRFSLIELDLDGPPRFLDDNLEAEHMSVLRFSLIELD